ncbi:MAG: TetR/AcrR family transcriptional regulator [Burkholderiaceae bacterium]|nr:TetR/AcrR family transcriptional regulator [Burkholderiaceae bacterium]
MPPKAQRTASAQRRKRSAPVTEAALLRAAEEVFAASGFVDATVADIVERAKVSRGTFYLYFTNKDDIFATLMSRVVDDMFVISATRQPGTVRERIEAGNLAFLETFKRHRKLMRSILHVASLDPAMARTLNNLRNQFADRVRRQLERGIGSGKCHPHDPAIASYALVVMVEFFAYSWLSFGFGPKNGNLDIATVASELSQLWYRSVYKE